MKQNKLKNLVKPRAGSKRILGRKARKTIRRIHLYLGLSLIPWLFLYGTTAIMFNHGSWFTDRAYLNLEATEESVLPAAEELAKQALQDLGNESLTLVPESAQWIGSLSFRAELEEQHARVRFDPHGYGGSLRLSPKSKDGPDWSSGLNDWKPISDNEQVQIEQMTLEKVQAVAPKIDSIKLRQYPDVQFQVMAEGQIFTVRLDLDGSMDVKTKEEGSPLRSKLLRLHMLHGDPGYRGALWIWALVVDVMGVAMILWGLTGLLMWWTIKPTRGTGAVALSLGSGLIGLLALSIWSLMGMN